jgi:hypothetical protein
MQINYIDINSESLDSFLADGWSLLSEVNGISLISKAGSIESFAEKKGVK